jgi:cyclohexadieny/prephenate dehydrogenase
MSKTYGSIAIVGVGLIGGSLIKLITREMPSVKLYGVDINLDSLSQAVSASEIVAGFETLQGLPQDISLFIVCTPMNFIDDTISQIASTFSHAYTVTDVGSVKQGLVTTSNLGPHVSYVPGHPMAGTENVGYANSAADILSGATYVLTGEKTEAATNLAAFLSNLGFSINWLSGQTHDHLVCLASHLPYLMASTVVGLSSNLSEEDKSTFKEIISSGFRDTTRVASSSPHWGVEVCLKNKGNVLEALKNVKDTISELENAIRMDDKDALLGALKKNSEQRNVYYQS